MDEQTARAKVESEGFKVIELLEADAGYFVFICAEDDAEIEVAVNGLGELMIEPT